MLADLDETLRSLLKRELEQHGFDGVEIAFDAPAKEWASTLTSPTVSLFLYDLREALQYRPIEWQEQEANGRTVNLRPPLRVDASFAVTAWTRAVEDEHRLLSQLMAILYAYTVLPEDVLAGALRNGSQQFPLRTRVAQERSDGGADFWSAVGGQYKASLDYVVTLSCDPGITLERGPEVRTQTIRLRDKDGGRSTVEELHRFGSVVRDADGGAVPNAWVVLEGIGWTVSASDGRFGFDRLRPGAYRCLVRTPEGQETAADVTVPGGLDEFIVSSSKRASKTRK